MCLIFAVFFSIMGQSTKPSTPMRPVVMWTLPPLLAEQVDFLGTQLLAWVRHFAARVAAVDASGYYAGLASVLVAFLDQDSAYLAEA